MLPFAQQVTRSTADMPSDSNIYYFATAIFSPTYQTIWAEYTYTGSIKGWVGGELFIDDAGSTPSGKIIQRGIHLEPGWHQVCSTPLRLCGAPRGDVYAVAGLLGVMPTHRHCC